MTVNNSNEESKVPKQVQDKLSTVHRNISVTFEIGDNTFENLFEDVILEYRDCADKEETFTDNTGRTYKFKYLETYVLIGIPSDMYYRVLREVNQVYGSCVESLHEREAEGYTWVVANIDTDLRWDVFDGDFIHTDSLGLLTNMFNIVHKSNVKGLARFKLQLCFSSFTRSTTPFLRFTLTAFIIYDDQ